MDEYDAVSAQCGELKKQEDALASEKDIDYEKLAEVRCELAAWKIRCRSLRRSFRRAGDGRGYR